jgi:hypothetical protein
VVSDIKGRMLVRVFEDGVLREIFGPEREGLTGNRWHGEDHDELRPLPNIIKSNPITDLDRP